MGKFAGGMRGYEDNSRGKWTRKWKSLESYKSPGQ